MRQRVLLVAGWVTLAALTSLVASAVMAVAGGQVSDRPLTKVLAADVAALPVVDTESDPLCEPLASGGFECTPALSGGAQDGPGSGYEPDSVGGEEGDAASRVGPVDPAEDPTFSDELPDPAALEALPAVTKIVTVGGGTVSFAVQGETIRVQWWIPQYGYSVIIDRSEPEVPSVTFSRGAVQTGVVARIVNGELTLNTFDTDGGPGRR